MRLSLMRHANAEHAHHSSDFDRDLSQHGQLEANSAGEFLCEYKIDKAIVSYVKRTLQTFELIQNQTGQIPAEIVTELYKNSSPEIIYDLLNIQENKHEHILVIGHNPLIYEITLMLVNPKSDQREFLITTVMPTARIVMLDFPEINNWADITAGQGNITQIFTPNIA
jgi:phosphohistidine phosphatase